MNTIDCSAAVQTNCLPPQDVWTVVKNADGSLTLRLGDKYEIRISENGCTVEITNLQTCETTVISGDPHINWDGVSGTEADFWGTTTFKLADGTKITIETTPSGNNMTVASKVTVTNGDNAIVVTGVDNNVCGDLSFTQSQDGRCIDQNTDDGFVVTENECGVGWIDPSDGCLVTTQDFIEARDGSRNNAGAGLGTFAFVLTVDVSRYGDNFTRSMGLTRSVERSRTENMSAA